jgi:hypothetical protein
MLNCAVSGRSNHVVVSKKPAQRLNFFAGPTGEIGDGALANFLVFPPNFAQ